MKINFIMRFHHDVPDGGRKILYYYANQLVSEGHSVRFTYLADTPFPDRKYNNAAKIKHALMYLRTKSSQDQISWYHLDPRIRIDASYRFEPKNYSDSDINVLFDFSIVLSVYSRLKKMPKNYVYLIQADERVYYSDKIIKIAWSIPIPKIVVSKYLMDLVLPYSSSSVYLVENFIDPEEFYCKEPIERREPTISFINHLNPSKGTNTALKIIQHLKPSFPNLSVISFGNPEAPDTQVIDQYYQHADVQTLRDKVYNKSTIYLSTSTNEGWGLTTAEAMSCGAALIAYENGGINDFATNSKSAMLVSPGDENKLEAELRYMLEHEEFRYQIAKTGVETIQKFSPQRSSKIFLQVLQTLAQKN